MEKVGKGMTCKTIEAKQVKCPCCKQVVMGESVYDAERQAKEQGWRQKGVLFVCKKCVLRLT